MQTLEDAWAVFIVHLEKMGKAPLTIKQYKIDGKQFIRYCWDQQEEMLRDDTIKKLVKSYREHVQQRYTNTQSINRKFASLRTFLHFAKFREWIRIVPEAYVKPIPKVQKALSVLTDEERARAVDVWLRAYRTMEDPEHRWMALRNFCITRLVSELALKPYEIVKMKWTHIDFDTRIVRIFGAKSYRDLELSDTMIAWLLLFEKRTHALFPELIEAEHIWLGLSNKAGTPITVKTIERIMLAISRELEKKVTCTNLRYTAMHQELLEQDLRKVKEIFDKYGYVHHYVMEERRRKIVRAVEEQANIRHEE